MSTPNDPARSASVGEQRTPRAPARARLPLLPSGPGGFTGCTPHEGSRTTVVAELRAELAAGQLESAASSARSSATTVVRDPSCGVQPVNPPGPEGSKGKRALAGARGVLCSPTLADRAGSLGVDIVSLALYRKYRPGMFAEVIGQEHVTEPLRNALRNGRMSHAYLFSGPRGCGKTSMARILARSLNCAQGPTPTPCGECDSCRDLAPNGPGSLDVTEIDAASHGGVDDARELRERAFYAPVSSRYKVYVIDEAHMVSKEGFNALLKLVEEPPEFVIFVFATTEPEKVISTIRSRTHHYPFRLVPGSVLRELSLI